MVDINNMANYKPVSKVRYEIHVCQPPLGTLVVNKFEQADTFKRLGRDYFTSTELQQMKQKNPQKYAFLQSLFQQGEVYLVNDKSVFVLAGTAGEMWTIKAQKLAATYTFVQNGQPLPITEQSLKSRVLKNGYLPWTVVRTRADTNVVFACFVPMSQKGQIATPWGAVLNYNDVGVKHGKGDFIIAQNANGMPNMGDRYVVNGEIFARTYTPKQKGAFDGCLIDAKNAPNMTIDRLPNLVVEANGTVRENPQMYDFVLNLCKQLCGTQHNELPMSVQESPQNPNEILLSAKTTSNFADKSSGGGTRGFKADGIQTSILIRKNNRVDFAIRSMNSIGKVRQAVNYRFTIPSKAGVNDQLDMAAVQSYLQNNSAIVFGLCGYVRESGISNSIVVTGAPNEIGLKREYDGIRDYTMTSGPTNRYLRGIYDSTATNEDKSTALRTIFHCDELFQRSRTQRRIMTFRGQVRDRFFDAAADYNNPRDAVVVNTAFNSTSLNMVSAAYFASAGVNAKGTFGHDQQGVVYVYDLPLNTSAVYAHSIAGWTEQYEVLLDRCYDTRIGNTILEFSDSFNNHYKVLEAFLVPHGAFQQLDAKQSRPLIEKGKLAYDVNGKVPCQYDFMDDVLHEAFNKIRESGFSDVQWNPGAKYTDEKDDNGNPKVRFKPRKDMKTGDVIINPSIVLRTKNPDKDNEFEDVSFELTGDYLTIHKLKTEAMNRGDHTDAKDLKYSEYGLAWNITHGKDVKFAYDMYNAEDNIDTLMLREVTSDEIAKQIINYAKKHKNLCLLPLIDVARYFDMTFRQVIVDEGYELLKQLRVERHCSEAEMSDPQAGFVPCRYLIAGDNDDHLTIFVRFFRDKTNNKLMLEYKGQSNNIKVNSSKKLGFSIFTDGVMSSVARNILYDFAKQMHLSKVRKIDNLIHHYAAVKRYRVREGLRTDDTWRNGEKTIKDKTGYTVYYGENKGEGISVLAYRSDTEVYTLELKSVADQSMHDSVNLDGRKTIYELTKDFDKAFTEVMSRKDYVMELDEDDLYL